MDLGDDRRRGDRERERVAVDDRQLGQPHAGNAHRVDEQHVRRRIESRRPPAASPRGWRAGCCPRRSGGPRRRRRRRRPRGAGSARSSRRARLGVERLESSRPGRTQPAGRITAPATTGPASEPRPASSTPATRAKPADARARIRARARSRKRPSSANRAASGSAVTGDEAELVGLLLVDARGLALAVAQVVELGAAHGAFALDLDAVDDRRVEREHALDADPARDLAHRERLARRRRRGGRSRRRRRAGCAPSRPRGP